jgi:hypothetical protein
MIGRNCFCLITLLAGLCCHDVGWAQARPTAPYLLPDTTLAYFRMSDSREFLAKMNEAAIGRMLKDEQVKPLADKLYGSLAQAFSRIQDQVGLPLEQILSIPQGEAYLALVPVDDSVPQPFFLLDTGNQIVRAQTLIARAEALLEQQGVPKTTEVDGDAKIDIYTPPSGDGPRNIVLFQKQGTIGISTSVPVAKGVLAAWRGESTINGKPFVPLAENRKFTSIMNRCAGTADERPQLTFFVDPIEIFRAIGRTNAGARTALAFLPVIGIDGIEGIGGSVFLITGEYENLSHLHLLLGSPRSGVVRALAVSSGDATPEPFITSDVINYMTIHWDFQSTLREVAKLVNSFQGEGAFSNLLKSRVSERLGIDFETDIVQQLTGRMSYAGLVEKPIRFNSNTQMIALQVKDPKAASASLDTVMARFSDTFSRKSFGGVTYYSTTINPNNPNLDFDQQQRRVQLEIRAQQPTLAVVSDYLVFSDSAPTLERCIAVMSDEMKQLANDLEFKLIASKIRRQAGGVEPGMITFSRPEEGMRFVYDLLLADETRRNLSSGAANNEFLRTIDSALQEHPLPPFSVLAKYLAPGGGMLTNDESGFHLLTFTLKRK